MFDWSFCDRMDCSPPGSSVHRILQARILEWVAMPSSTGSSWPQIEPIFLMSPSLASRFFTTSAMWEDQSLCQFSSVQFSHSVVSDSLRPHGHQASLSITNSWSLLKLMSIESVMPSNHIIPCHPLLLPPSIFPSIRVFLNESVLCIRWPVQCWQHSQGKLHQE